MPPTTCDRPSGADARTDAGPRWSRGDQTPRDNAERLRLARRASQKALHATAARLWTEALTADPGLGDDRRVQHRYSAISAAAPAGCGKGKDDPSPEASERAGLRRQARSWLEAERAAWAKVLESGPARARPRVARILEHWQRDTDLAGIRDEKELAGLPEAERKEWRSLWANVEALRKRAKTESAPAVGAPVP